MTSVISRGWCELQRTSQNDCPKLFYSVTSSEDGFQLYLTDLLAIWECMLKRREILQHAQEQNASIDPSESNAQFLVLLQKLEHGIRSDQNVLYRETNADSQILYLRTYVKLPQPLSPLIWTFNLIPQEAVELGEQLLRPCLLEASTSRQKLASLQQVIKDKDHVISRLLEKLEGSNTDLSLIFPGVKSRRGRVTVSEAEKHVPGMAAFNEAVWSSHFDTSNPYASYDSKGFDNLVSGCQSCPKHTTLEHSSWYRHLPDEASALIQKPNSSKARQASPDPVKADHNDHTSTSEDEFERQVTPPHLQKKSNSFHIEKRSDSASTEHSDSPDTTKASSLPNALSSTKHTGSLDTNPYGKSSSNQLDASSDDEDDDDLDAPTQKSFPKEANSVSFSSDDEKGSSSISQNKRKLGGLKKTAQQRHTKYQQPSTRGSPSPVRLEPPKRRLGALRKLPNNAARGDDSGDDSGDDTTHDQKSSTPPPPRRLGRLGKKNAATHDDDAADDDDDNNSHNHHQPKSQKVTHQHRKPASEQKTKSIHQEDPSSDATATASPTPTPSPSPEPDPNPQTTPHKTTTSSATNPAIKSEDQDRHQPIPRFQKEPESELTVDEKANLRREELKRKVDVGSGTRKKRKF